jgi:DNA-binding response OmpR family regulator
LSCAECDRLRAQLAEAREEIRAWEEFDRQDGRVDADEERLAAWRRVYGLDGVQPVLTLMALCDRPGRLLSREALIRATRYGAVKSADDVHRTIATTTICKLRRLLQAVAAKGGLPAAFAASDAGIFTHWGQGWSMTPENAAAVRALAGEA